MGKQQISRRGFLAAAGAAAVAAPGALEQEPGAKPLRVGIIGVGGRGTHWLRLILGAGAEVPAICDIHEGHLNRAIGIVEKAREGRKPVGYSKGPYDYRRMLQRDDLDAIIVTTPVLLHAEMSVDALRAGKHVLSEVSAAMTVEECWNLVRATEESRKVYMLAENCCYWYHAMLVRHMVHKGLFGDLTYAECGYVHDCRGIAFKGDGSLTWRGELYRDVNGNWYPTHSLGPVAQWLGIHRGDRMVSLVATRTRQAAMEYYATKRFPEGHRARKVRFGGGDSITCLIRTAKGAVIDLRFDASSARPHPTTTYYGLQGLKASYDSKTQQVWLEGRSKGYRWEALSHYAKEFEHPKYATLREKSRGANGDAPFVFQEFLEAVRTGGPPPIDVYDAVAWSCITPLSAKSVAEGGRPQEIPDFTKGKWETRKG